MFTFWVELKRGWTCLRGFWVDIFVEGKSFTDETTCGWWLRCVVRYGYKDVHADDSNFENRLILNLAEFIQTEGAAPWIPSSSEISLDGRMTVMGTASNRFLTTSSLPFSLNHMEERTASLPTSNGDSIQASIRLTLAPFYLQSSYPLTQHGFWSAGGCFA